MVFHFDMQNHWCSANGRELRRFFVPLSIVFCWLRKRRVWFYIFHRKEKVFRAVFRVKWRSKSGRNMLTVDRFTTSLLRANECGTSLVEANFDVVYKHWDGKGRSGSLKYSDKQSYGKINIFWEYLEQNFCLLDQRSASKFAENNFTSKPECRNEFLISWSSLLSRANIVRIDSQHVWN